MRNYFVFYKFPLPPGLLINSHKNSATQSGYCACTFCSADSLSEAFIFTDFLIPSPFIIKVNNFNCSEGLFSISAFLLLTKAEVIEFNILTSCLAIISYIEVISIYHIPYNIKLFKINSILTGSVFNLIIKTKFPEILKSIYGLNKSLHGNRLDNITRNIIVICLNAVFIFLG